MDILSLVTKDVLLVELFGQKLKLTLHDKEKSLEEKENHLREIIAKEQELLIQLQEGEAVVDDKQKGKKAPVGAKSPQDIEEEIKALMKPAISGWVLIDFPRNIEQAKWFEMRFKGF